jgi:hypothetical protein
VANAAVGRGLETSLSAGVGALVGELTADLVVKMQGEEFLNPEGENYSRNRAVSHRYQ